MTLKDQASDLFAKTFGKAPDLVTRAPGRVNLIGEHTDYNDGFVLPAGISRQTLVAASARDDGKVRVIAGDLGGLVAEFSVAGEVAPSTTDTWSNYVRGMAALMPAEGVAVRGADLAIVGDMPQGAGLSSSAALENAVGLAFAALDGQPDFDRTRLALVGQQTEHRFAGCNCGIMDQLVSARAVEGAALLIDTRSLETRAISTPDDLAIMIVHSGVERGLVDGKYNERRRQCEAAVAHYGVKALRDLSEEALVAHKAGLDPVAFRRARHVVSDSARALAAAEALEAADLKTLGELMRASHLSMRDDFEITVPAVDALAEILNTAIGDEGGARMTGGGFGGAVVALLPVGEVERVREAVLGAYRTPAGEAPLVMIERPSAGVSLA
jgi:galactokinase